MTGIWTADDVLFASVRATRGDAREIARDLLAAAGAPGSLDGVTPAQARICAAEILHRAGDLDAALAAANDALATAAPADFGPGEWLTLAEIFVATGDTDRAVELAAWARPVQTPPSCRPGLLSSASSWAGGHNRSTPGSSGRSRSSAPSSAKPGVSTRRGPSPHCGPAHAEAGATARLPRSALPISSIT